MSPFNEVRTGQSFAKARVLRNAILATTIALGVATLFLLFAYRVHVYWWFNRIDDTKIHSIAVRQMPNGQRHGSSWVNHKVGGAYIMLPPEFSTIHTNDNESLVFKYETFLITVAMPSDANEFNELLESASRFSIPQQSFTLPKLRAACYNVDSSDFSWSMSTNEVRWHSFLVSFSPLLRLRSSGEVEFMKDKNIDGIVHFDSDRAVFDWHDQSTGLRGHVHFVDRDKVLDFDLVRAVCRSIRTKALIE